MKYANFQSVESKDDITEEVIEALCNQLLGNIKWSPSLCSRSTAEAVWSSLTETARENGSAETVREKVKDQSGDSQLADRMAQCYQKYGNRLRSQLHTIRWDHPELVDVNWMVAKTAESSILAKVSAPIAEIKLRTIETGESKSKELRFDCDEQQLQDLHWKVKEAMNTYKQLKAFKQ